MRPSSRPPNARWADDAVTFTTKAARIVQQAMHEQAMGSQPIGAPLGLPICHRIISGKGVTHLLNLPRQAKHALPSSTAVTCSTLSVLFTTVSEAWMVRMRLPRLSCGVSSLGCWADKRPTRSPILATSASMRGVRVKDG